MQKIFINKSEVIKAVLKIIFVLIIGFLTVVLFSSVTAFILCRTDFSESVMYPVSTAILTVSVFADAFILSRIIKENGLIIGIITGLAALIFITAFSFYFKLFALSKAMLTKTVSVLLAGCLGGILGVNTD